MGREIVGMPSGQLRNPREIQEWVPFPWNLQIHMKQWYRYLFGVMEILS